MTFQSRIDDLTPAQFQRIASAIRSDSGINLTDEKLPLVNSRLAKRVRKLKLPDFESYCDLIASDGGRGERAEMLSAMTTNVTSFFRENHHFEEFKAELLPPLAAQAEKGGSVRIWSAGCSSGEEAYSIAMTIAEHCGAQRLRKMDIRILATDIDPYVLEKARAGVYPHSALSGGMGALVRRYVEDVEGGASGDIRVIEDLRQIIKFNHLNLMGDWPMRRSFDVIFCRNVMIYFDAPTQERLLKRLASRLSPGGGLFLGHSERIPESLASSFRRGALTSYRRSSDT